MCTWPYETLATYGNSVFVYNMIHERMTEGDVEIDGARFGRANQELMARGGGDAWSLVG